MKSTAPFLQEHGERLTRHFYQRMFHRHPEVRPYFNPAHQAGGAQQRALAGAICAFASHVDQLEVLGAAVERIAQKHAGLRILPEHYPIVGENLLAAIREVLGDAATPEILDAWEEAYGFLSALLIGREREIYLEQEKRPHGWVGFRKFRIGRKVSESEVVTSFHLVSPDGSPVPSHLPGQYLTVRVPDEDGGSTTMRNYSLSSVPRGDHFRISVKVEPGGVVSNYLHSLPVGAEVEVGPPCGGFHLNAPQDACRPLVLISAGVGITPLLSMLQAVVLAQPERNVVFIHGALGGRSHAFREEVRSMAAMHPQVTVHFRYSEPEEGDRRSKLHDDEGFIDGALIERYVPDHRGDFYFCGPPPFMAAVHRQLLTWGVPRERIHFECFGPHREPGETPQ